MPSLATAQGVAPPPIQVPAPASTPTSILPPQIVPPPPPVAVVLPQLTTGQAIQLASLIGKDAVAQGLSDTAPATPADNDALVRAALDHAKAVHAGRLAEADFQRDWAMRPAAYDPLPGFAAAVASDRLAAWIASLPPPYAGYDTLVAGLARYRGIAASVSYPA